MISFLPQTDIIVKDNYTGSSVRFNFLTKDLNFNDVLSFAEAVFSHQLIVALVLSDGFQDGDLCLQGCPVHLKIREV